MPLYEFNPNRCQYNHLNFSLIKIIEECYFNPTDIIHNNIERLIQKYNISLQNTIAVLNRGTDKYTEVTLAPTAQWIQVIKNLCDVNDKILIQTDDYKVKTELIDYFGKQSFVFADEMIFSETYSMPQQKDSIQWAINFESIMRIISKCRTIITHTGNCGIIPIIYKRNANNVTQLLHTGIFKQL